MKKLTRILVVLFSLTMLVGYVIRAERSQDRKPVDSPGATNPSPVVASSSKSIAPVLTVPGLPSDLPGRTQNPRAFFPGSKSAQVFDRLPDRAPVAFSSSNQPSRTISTNSRLVMPGSKSAPVAWPKGAK